MRNAGVMATVAFFAIVLCFAPVVHPQGRTPPEGLLAELQAQIDALQARVETLEGVVAELDLVALQASVDTLEDLTQFQIVVAGEINGLAGPHLIFEGINLHIESGSGSTADGGSPIGLGNLVVGYNEEPPALAAGDRDGSHNIVLGPEHKYLSTGGFVAGFRNTISGLSASVSGGETNTASGERSSVSGGLSNEASGQLSSVSGGFANEAIGDVSSVSGGLSNEAIGFLSSVSGGLSNEAIGFLSSVSGGLARTAPGANDWAAGSLLEDF